MRIAFISANREIMPDAVIPIGLLQVMATVPERHEKLFWDLCFESDPLATVADKLRQQQPDLVAIGLRNIQNMDYTNITVSLDYYRRLLATVRAHSSAPIVLGGGGFSVMPREMMEALGAEYGIAGEGERAFAELLEQLEQPSPSLGHIERLHYRVDGALRSNGSALEPLDVDAQPRADRSVLPERYYSEYGIESLQTKRGCPLHCEYCTYPLIEGARSRTRDPARVADEFMQICARPGVGHVFIVDSVFNLPPRHAKAVCRELVAHGNRTPWTSYVNPMAFDDELAGLMVGAGAAGVEVGSDSGCDEVLDRLRKGFRTDKIRRLAQVCRAHGLKDCHSFILGTRGETLDDVDRSLDFVEELDPFAALMLVWVEDREVVDARRERERREFRDAIYARLAERASRQPRWSVPRLGIRFDPRTFAVLRRLGMRGPLWQYLDREPARKSAASGAGSVDAAEAAPITSA